MHLAASPRAVPDARRHADTPLPARIACETLALVGLPAMVLDASGRVLAANDLIDPVSDVVEETRERLWFHDPPADARFRRGLAALEADGAGATYSFATCHRGERLVAHLLSCRGTSTHPAARCAAILVLCPVAKAIVPSADLLQSLFEFTTAEAGVARGIASGETVAEIAERRSVSRGTVRAQLRAIMAKSGCRRQAEMVALLTGVALAQVGRR